MAAWTTFGILGAIAQRSDAGASLCRGRLDADHAIGARILSYAGAAHQAQADRDRHHLSARASLHQEADLPDVCQRDQPGQRGSFSIDGFGEAAQAYFGKDVRQLDLAECALLAGMIQSPNRLNPFRHPDRAMERRNLVLDSMVETGAITKEQAESAKDEPLHLTPGSVDASEAPYFVDLVRDELMQKLGDRDFNREGLRIYTSLDPDLQRWPPTAVDSTMPKIDAQVDKLHARAQETG